MEKLGARYRRTGFAEEILQHVTRIESNRHEIASVRDRKPVDATDYDSQFHDRPTNLFHQLRKSFRDPAQDKERAEQSMSGRNFQNPVVYCFRRGIRSDPSLPA